MLDHDDVLILYQHVYPGLYVNLGNKPKIKAWKMYRILTVVIHFTLSVESRSWKRTKPNPFERPDLSNLTVALSTLPKLAKYSQRCSKR